MTRKFELPYAEKARLWEEHITGTPQYKLAERYRVGARIMSRILSEFLIERSQRSLESRLIKEDDMFKFDEEPEVPAEPAEEVAAD